MTSGGRGRAVAVAALIAIAGSLAGCGSAAEFRGYDSGLDGTLWRQVMALKDPLASSIYGPFDPTVDRRHELAPDLYPPALTDPAVYLAGISGARWDGSVASVPTLGLDTGAALLYDVAVTDTSASFSVFISSGPRSGAAGDDGRAYAGPSEVYTCFAIAVDFADPQPRPRNTDFDDCPTPLVEALAPDAAFAGAEVFTG